MRRIKHISFGLILIGFIAMTLHVIIPHHHHNASVCFDLESIAGISCDNTEHNHSAKSECPDNKECNAKDLFINRTSNDNTTDSYKYLHLNSKLLLECVQFVSYILKEQFLFSKTIYNLFTQKDYSYYIVSAGGLRAPPCFIA